MKPIRCLLGFHDWGDTKTRDYPDLPEGFVVTREAKWRTCERCGQPETIQEEWIMDTRMQGNGTLTNTDVEFSEPQGTTMTVLPQTFSLTGQPDWRPQEKDDE